MPRKTTAYADATPYIATWANAGADITSSAADSPVWLPGLSGATFANFTFSGATASKTFTWHLNLVDTSGRTDGDSNLAILRTIKFTSEATARRSHADGAGGHYMHDDVIVDIDGQLANSQASADHIQWCLELVSIDSDTAARLINYSPTKAPGTR